MFDRTCNDCKYAVWDYEEYEGGARRWFFDCCLKDLDGADDDCEGYDEIDN
jgi:hypothetical protein